MLISNIVREVCVSVEHHKVEEHPVEEVEMQHGVCLKVLFSISEV